MASLHVFVCLLGLVVLCHSDCSFEALVVKDVNNPPKGCVDKDGKEHAFGSRWLRDCIGCYCTREGFTCCSLIPKPGSFYIPEECELVVDKKLCSFKLVLKSEKTKDCYSL